MLIQCFEPQGQPRRIAIEVGPSSRFCLYAIQDMLGEDAKGLRVTVLRQPDQAPPPRSQFMVELEVRRRRPNEGPSYRVLRVGRGITLEWLRHDGRSRVTTSTDLKDGSRFEVTLPDMRSVIFAIESKTEVEQGAGAGMGGKGKRTGGGAAATMGLSLIVPTAVALASDPIGRVRGEIAQVLRRMGLSPALVVPAMMTASILLVSAAVAFDSYSKKAEAEASLAEVMVEKEQAEAGRDAALIAESACVQERQDIAKKLDDVTQARILQAEVALAVPMSQSIAVELGGARMGNEDALAYDTVAVKNTRGYLVAEMGKKRKDIGDPARCLAQAGALGQDLPEYVLYWHPKTEFLCPDDFVLADGAVDRAGPWGISSRAAAEFGAAQNLTGSQAAQFGKAPEDPRLNHRWSGHAMSVGLRKVAGTLLEADTGERPPVSPGQAHLWSLAVWDAYNQLPSPAEGVMDLTAEECVKDLMAQVIRASGPAEPGQPVLPDISRLALGDEIPLKPSAGCPWPSDALTKGATNALEAVTRLAVFTMEAEAEG